MIRRGKRACRAGRVASNPELSVGGPGWLPLWGVAGSPSVDTLAEGDAPSSPELTVGMCGGGACGVGRGIGGIIGICTLGGGGAICTLGGGGAVGTLRGGFRHPR